MSIFAKIRKGWRRLSTAEKIGVVIDVVCNIGGVMAAGKIGDKLTEDSDNIVEKVCIKTVMAGAGMAVTNIAAAELKETYGTMAAKMIDRAREDAKTETEKEEEEDDE